MFITKKHISRRTVLRGMGVTMALPLLEAMVPARTAFAKTAAGKVRLAAIEMVHGSAGATTFGLQKNLWSPAAVGRGFDLSPTSLAPLEPFRDYLTIVSNTDVRNAEAFELPEIGGDHFRSSAVFLTQAHPQQTQGSDVRAGASLDQLYAQKFGQETPIPSMQLCIERRRPGRRLLLRLLVRLHRHDQLGRQGCAAADDSRPAAGVRSVVRRRRHAGRARAAPRRGQEHPRLDQRAAGAPAIASSAPPTAPAWRDYLDDVREIERRIQKVEAYNRSGEQREMPAAPVGVPDSFDEHVKLMFDLQALAFASPTPRACSRSRWAATRRAASIRERRHHRLPPGVAPRRSRGSHPRLREDQQVPRRHAAVLPQEAEGDARTARATCSTTRWWSTDRRWATRTSTTTSAARCSSSGKAGGALKGGLHIKAADGTPMANAMLGVAARDSASTHDDVRRQHR